MRGVLQQKMNINLENSVSHKELTRNTSADLRKEEKAAHMVRSRLLRRQKHLLCTGRRPRSGEWCQGA